MKTLPLIAALFAIPATGTAAPRVYEGFSVPPYSGDIIGENGGIGWSEPWTNPGSPKATDFDSEPIGLTDPSLQTTTGGLTVAMSANISAGIDRTFSTAGFGSTVYFGLLISVTRHSTFNTNHTFRQSSCGCRAFRPG